MAKEYKIKGPGTGNSRNQDNEKAVAGTIESCTDRGTRAPITEKTRADYEEDYKRAHIGLIAEFVRDAAGM